MIANLPTALILILGAFALPLLRGWVRHSWSLLLPIAAFIHLLLFANGEISTQFFNLELQITRIDELSLIFG